MTYAILLMPLFVINILKGGSNTAFLFNYFMIL